MPDHAYQTLTLDLSDGIATLCLNRPDSANGLNVELAAELRLAARRLAADSEVRCVILTGHGRFFCAGGDINAMQAFGEDAGAGLKGIADDLHSAMSSFTRMSAPMIVAVNGTAAGAGFSLAVSGDLVFASEAAKFTMAYSKIGLSPDGGASYFLPRLIGLRKTQELMFTNRVLSASEACEWGLINAVVPPEELLPLARKTAGQLTAASPGSNAAIKKLLSASAGHGLETQLELEARYIASNADSRDGKEGVAAFLEKRQPKFGG